MFDLLFHTFLSVPQSSFLSDFPHDRPAYSTKFFFCSLVPLRPCIKQICIASIRINSILIQKHLYLFCIMHAPIPPIPLSSVRNNPPIPPVRSDPIITQRLEELNRYMEAAALHAYHFCFSLYTDLLQKRGETEDRTVIKKMKSAISR